MRVFVMVLSEISQYFNFFFFSKWRVSALGRLGTYDG
jgi:hypothetical protein